MHLLVRVDWGLLRDLLYLLPLLHPRTATLQKGRQMIRIMVLIALLLLISLLLLLLPAFDHSPHTRPPLKAYLQIGPRLALKEQLYLRIALPTLYDIHDIDIAFGYEVVVLFEALVVP